MILLNAYVCQSALRNAVYITSKDAYVCIYDWIVLTFGTLQYILIFLLYSVTCKNDGCEKLQLTSTSTSQTIAWKLL